MMSHGRLFGRLRFSVGNFKTAQNFVGGVLQPCIRLVKLTGSLAGQRTKLVAIFYMRKCLKNEIGTHCLSPFSSNSCTGIYRGPASAAEGKPIQPKTNGGATPNCNLPILDAHRMPRVQKHLGGVARCEMDAMPYRIRSLR